MEALPRKFCHNRLYYLGIRDSNTMWFKNGNFLIFCIEMYKSAKKMTGKQVINLFRQYGISEYIMDCFESLHTTGTNYIVEDIDLYIEAHRTA